ncbi:MAG: hypothetical protein AAB289_02185 [Chloroflexota bacterium]
MPGCNGGAGPDFTRPSHPCGEHSGAGFVTATRSIAHAGTDDDAAPNGDPDADCGPRRAAHPLATHGNPGTPDTSTASTTG